jgi:hypothetical protein
VRSDHGPFGADLSLRAEHADYGLLTRMLELTDTDHDAELCGLPVVPRSRSVPVGRMGGRREVE